MGTVLLEPGTSVSGANLKSSARPLRVAMVSQTYPPFVGGVAAQLATISAELYRQGVEVSVITKQMPDTPQFEVIANVPVYRIPFTGARAMALPRFIGGVYQTLRQIQPNVIHAHELLLPTTAAILSKKLLQVPLVVTIHASGPQLGEVARLQRATLGSQRWAFLRNHVDSFVSISNATDDDLADANVPVTKRVAIPNGIDMEHFAPVSLQEKQRIRRLLQLPDCSLACPIVVFTGRLASEKRVAYLLKVWPAVQEQFPDAQLVIVGNGSEEEKLRQKQCKGVHFTGGQADVAPYLRAADLFVMPSAAEGFSLATLEAMAVGLPCIATSVGAIPQFMEHGISGWIIQPDDIPGLKSALLHVLGNPDLCVRMGQAARRRVERHYAVSSIADRLHGLYTSLL